MNVDVTVEAPAAPGQRFDVLAQLDELQRRLRSTECRAANLERALTSNRRIGIAIGILMCQLQLTDDQAFAVLTTSSQHRNVRVGELAETVIYTGTR